MFINLFSVLFLLNIIYKGTTWGLGGTCVNVGCVPKKLMHYAGLLGHGFYDAKALGWHFGVKTHEWSELVHTVTNHVRMLNFRYRVGLKNKDVTYVTYDSMGNYRMVYFYCNCC